MVIKVCPDCGGAIEIDFDFGELALLICWACGWEVEFKPGYDVSKDFVIVNTPIYEAADDFRVTLKFVSPEDEDDTDGA